MRIVHIAVAATIVALGLAQVPARGSDAPAPVHHGRDPMVMTVLEAHVAPDRWAALQQSYQTRAAALAPPIVESFLVQGAADSTLWRIVTVWASLEALEAMRRSGDTPTGVLIFRDAGAEPSLSVFTVRANPRAPAGPAG